MFQLESGEPNTVGDLVAGYLDLQQRQLVDADISLRDRLDDVHATRVAIRRYRSALRVFGDVFADDHAATLDVELQWYADLRRARANLHRAMSTTRYRALLDEMHSWREAVPFTDRATREPAAVALYLRDAKRTMVKRVQHASADVSRHPARKAAKRARYAADLAKPVLRKDARRVAKWAKQVQIELGARQDSVVARDFLLGLTDDAGPDVTFVLGVFYDRELYLLGR